MEKKIQIIDGPLLDSISSAASESERLRKNYNLHASYEEPCQRLLNAIEPGTYIRPHRHLAPPKPETFVAVRGQMAILLFNDRGEVLRGLILSPQGDVAGADIPAGIWHTVISLEAGSVFFEAKPGPFSPLSDKDWAAWAPPEGEKGAGDYLKKLEMIVAAGF